MSHHQLDRSVDELTLSVVEISRIYLCLLYTSRYALASVMGQASRVSLVTSQIKVFPTGPPSDICKKLDLRDLVYSFHTYRGLI